MKETVIDALLHPKESFERTEALRECAADLGENPSGTLPAVAVEFLNSYQTEDQVQAALIGIALHRLARSRTPQIGVLARLFPALFMDWEPHIRKEAEAIFAGLSTKDVFGQLTEMVGMEEGTEVDRYYAFNVISTVDYDDLT
ncbi:hypothetical protein B5M42_005915 [Paenibacillus athensensis]|uniref:Uncharacterized protein n=1 Tax=Paenibacillus athensensis TaxID=1967502 RepID=A0A4Y8Q5X3_9BACL|nr:hypothetical protein [Paenibacillus athensensis]MCD1258376.1 hypothetical protein [Paenibacillus athensensis]